MKAKEGGKESLQPFPPSAQSISILVVLEKGYHVHLTPLQLLTKDIYLGTQEYVT